MATSREIEKLERLWKENPQGTVFTPFAEALRRDGQPGRAKEVLELGLQGHPDHIPANIVLGRCCLDMEEIAAAEHAFARVVELDSENVIALKALADITERHGRYAEADQWIRRLIAVDPGNDEARDQATRIAAARDQAATKLYAAPPAAAPQPAVASATEVASGVIPGEEDTVVVASVRSLAEPTVLPVPPAAGATVAMPSLAEATTVRLPSMPEDLGVPSAAATVPERVWPEPSAPEAGAWTAPPSQALVELSPEAVSLGEDLVVKEEEPAGSHALSGIDPSAQVGARRSLGIGVEIQEEIVLSPGSGTEYQTPSAAEQLMGSPAPTVERLPEPVPPRAAVIEAQPAPVTQPEPLVISRPELPEPAEVVKPGGLPLIFPEEVAATAAPRLVPAKVEPAPAKAEPAEEGEGPGEPELVVTETMAEVYLRQGHREEAARVYRELLERSPSDSRLQAKLAAVEFGEVETGTAAATEQWPGFAASATGGESVAAFFGSLLANRPLATMPVMAAETESPAPVADAGRVSGAPTRPASDAVSLSAIFGDEGSPAAPGVRPASGGIGSTPNAGPPGSYSFDQFFRGTTGASAGLPGHSPSGGHPRPSSLEEDLDQFQNWLKSLKR